MKKNRKPYYGLDDVGIVGTGQRRSGTSQRSAEKRTGDIFNKARKSQSASHRTSKKVAVKAR